MMMKVGSRFACVITIALPKSLLLKENQHGR